MIITNVKEKLEQVDRLMDKKGFYLLLPSECESLNEMSQSWGSSEYDNYYWHDLTYVKSYGKDNQHKVFVKLGTTEKLFHLKGNFYISHLDISNAYLRTGDIIHLNNVELANNEIKELYKSPIYLIEAIGDLASIRKALNKISSYTED